MLQKFWPYVARCSKEYAKEKEEEEKEKEEEEEKEKEKNATTSVLYHRALLTSMGDYFIIIIITSSDDTTKYSHFRSMTLRIITWTLKVLYSKNIAGSSVAILIRWSGIARPIDCFNRVFEENSDFFNFFGRVQTTLSYAPETRHTTYFTTVIMLVMFLLQLIIHCHS